MKNSLYITINHLDEYGGPESFRINDKLIMKKDLDNPFDDEAIAIYNDHNIRCGYVANSVSTVARGTYSAGRVYDKIPEECGCIVRFISEDHLITELAEERKEEDDV